jgi:sterol desaturase/sphingolipid hydroxylase (fatty acid hydroxylase superfamily)
VVVNIVPIVALARLLKVYILTFWLFLAGCGVKASLSHSGYDVDLFVKYPKFHDLHHKRLGVNYGLIGWMDVLHGTRYSGRLTMDGMAQPRTA